MSSTISLQRSTIKSLLYWGAKKLKNTSLSPNLDAQILLSFALNKPKEYFFTYPMKKPAPAQTAKFKNLVERRVKYEPIAYITGHKEFYNLDFQVSKDVLIPRSETELMVSEALEIINNEKSPLIIDIGTGSGCIPIAIAKNLKLEQKNIFAIDISQKALKIAKQNTKRHKLAKKIKFLQGNLLEPIASDLKEKKYSPVIITANLPYLPIKIYKVSSLDVKKYEPKNALVGGGDGLKYYKDLFAQIKKLDLDAIVLCEIDPPQKKEIKNLINKYFSKAKVQIKKDLAGLERLVIIK